VTVVVGTAGHIDHGKTTLLHALTGIDADRLPEERRRGMTIDVGYAHLRLADGSELDFVDVPGHDRLVGNMLVGAGEIDAAMLVVAADDGPRAQTIEHLELLDALGIDDGLAVVTKIDAVSPERVGEVIDETSRLLARTRLAGRRVLAVSAVSGAGVAELLGELAQLREHVASASARDGPARLAIDRAFSMKGRGAVITGTLRGAAGVGRGDTLRLLPGAREVRVREVQVHGEAVERAIAGRTALNLAGADVSELHRGMVLTGDVRVAASDRILVALRPATGLSGRSRAIPSDRARVRVHIATEQVGATVGRSGRDGVELPYGETSAILRLERSVALAPGDRFVLRRASPAETLAGGRVLDVEPPRGVGRRRMTQERLVALAAAVAADATVTADAAATARLELHGALADGHVRLAPDVAADLRARILAEIDRTPAGRTLAELRGNAATNLRRAVRLAPEAARDAAANAIDELVAEGALVRVGEIVSLPGHAPVGPSPAVLAAMDRLVRALDVLTPPSLAEAARAVGCPGDGIRALEAASRIVLLDDDLAYATTTYAALEDRAVALAAAAPLTPAAFRDATGTSRKYVMAILEDLDRRGVLRRTPDGHVPGSRAAMAGAPGGRR
jgi:selenocysteine-specific elongation factor